jgi:hypothetical protein
VLTTTMQEESCRLYNELLALVVLLSFNTMASAGNQGEIRGLIPMPKQCSLESGTLAIVTDGKSNLVVVMPENPDAKEALAAKWVAKEVTERSSVTPEITADDAGSRSDRITTRLVLASFNRPSRNLTQLENLLDSADRELLADARRSEQGYVLRAGEGRIAIVGGTPQGTLYGAMTLLQLFQGDRDGLSVPRVHVRDWPDFRYREAENWTYTEGRQHWGRGWCYDWGDGVTNYRKRVESIFDRCLRYKINMICFSSGFGESFYDMWNADQFPMQKDLNRMADQRGIKLMIGGYGIGCNVGGFGIPPAASDMVNRKSYPDGEKYLCLTTSDMGNCRANDALTKRIQDRIRDYVRKTEPRALYLHHEDSDTYASAEWLWKHRCDQCRKRWPNDEMAAADGAAGGFAHGYNALCDAMFNVKNSDSGYDAARDCLVMFVSPTYTASFESDAVWDKQLAYWKTVSGLLRYKKNVCIGIREQFLRADNGKKRVLEMANSLRSGGDGPGLFLFFVSPASIYQLGPLFAPVPAAMSRLNEGAEVAYYMCGNIFQEPQILMNAAYMWNSDSPGAIALPSKAGECLDLYNRYARRQSDPPGIFDQDGFLQFACRLLYGEKAGRHMETLYAMKRFPLCLARELYIWNARSGLYYDWAPELKTTQEAISCVDAALRESDCKPENRALLERFLKSLRAGEQFAQIRLAYQQLPPLAFLPSTTDDELKSKAAQVESRIHEMEKYLDDNFSFDWATPRGGDIGIWRSHLADMRGVLTRTMAMWTEAIRARQSADDQAASGVPSLVTNGKMEKGNGWKFVRVTGDEEVGYADGGYADDKAASGKRAYKLVKLPVERLSDKWPMPQRTTWAEIQQDLSLEPGQKYTVAFQVFNNYGGACGVQEHQARMDDREMWSLDASAPKGWKSGGFFFVPKTAKVRLTLRTTDVRPMAGWRAGDGDSWWDDVRIYPMAAADK